MRGSSCDDAPMHKPNRALASVVRIPLGLLAFAAAASTAWADVSLDTPFQDHAVLQRDREIRVTGHAEPNEALTLTFGGARIAGRADAEGRFSLALAPMPASLEARELVV